MAQLHLHGLCTEITTCCLEVDEWVRRECGHKELRESIDQFRGSLDKTDPLSYLKNAESASIWDIYFQEVLREWDGDRLSAQQYNYIIERLSKNAAQFDQLIPQLSKELSRFKYPDFTHVMAIKAVQMQSCLNSFLNSADEGLNYWKHQEGILKENNIRRRRPVPKFDYVTEAVAVNIDSRHDDSSISVTASKLRAISRELFLTDQAIVALTWLVSIAACSLQVWSFIVTQQTYGRRSGSFQDADFLTNLQQSLMQLLTFYTSLVPVLRSQVLPDRYATWTWFLSFGGCVLGAMSTAIYPYFTAMSPLLSMLGNVLQAGLVLQLVLCIVPLDSIAMTTKSEHSE